MSISMLAWCYVLVIMTWHVIMSSAMIFSSFGQIENKSTGRRQ